MPERFAKPIRILMVDGDAPLRLLAERAFELLGLPADVSASPRGEAAHRLARREADAVLVDVSSASDAPARIEALRSAVGTERTPIFAFKEEADEIGADYVFERPSDEGGFFGVAAAIKLFWMNAAPSLRPPPARATEHPRPVPGVDLMSLPIEPIEAYLLSMVDGALTVDDLGQITGAGAQVRPMLRRLVELGAVSWTPTQSLPPRPPSMPVLRDPSVPPPSPTPSDPAAIRWDEARRKAVDEMHAMLDDADHYQLLGVARDASRGDIREAYFRLAKRFHTDTLFGLDLGEYHKRMDRVFQAITEAYNVLGKKKKRDAYDAYLAAFHDTEALDRAHQASMWPSLPPPPVRTSIPAPPPTHVSLPSPPPHVSLPAPPAPPTAVTPPPPEALAAASAASTSSAEAHRAPSSSDAGRPAPRRPSGEADRRAIAARLARDLGSAPGSTRKRPPLSTPPVSADPESTVRSLARALSMVGKATGAEDRASRLLEDARVAKSQGNLTAAATAMMLAQKWRPDDDAIQKEAESVLRDAVTEKRARFEERARYAEQRQMWEEAAKCWIKVADVTPDDAVAMRRAAVATLKARTDLSEGVRLVRRLLEKDPDNAASHRLLGELFAAASKPASARRALADALRIDPNDALAKSLLAALGES
ncbi:MAG: DnaJ domain-containing protein [Sandaracinaceae bacterium]